MAGASYSEISASADPETGERLYSDGPAAVRAVQAAKKRYAEGAELLTEEERACELEVARLDRVQRALWPAAMQGSVTAVREIRQIVMARAKLLGFLDGPSEPKNQAKGDALDDLSARRAARRAAASG